ncbi:hypothetical protein [Pseudomonas protegens]|uniref:hypothetical protein n=1 Tax=Pseudomonas protegens TaxID=380021 RepID=UPI001E284184|nr:hypothetical protein [Pseudomonas protegens]MCD9568839.1 hypothetical protein [Pseudomonas protegens]
MESPEALYNGLLIRPVGGGLVELTGWLVIIDYRLFIVADAHDKAKRIEFFDSAVVFSVEEKISPLGGGGSFIFHRAKVVGWLVEAKPPKIKPVTLNVEERTGEVVSIDLESKSSNKARYDEFLRHRDVISSVDWLDFYKKN